MANLLEICELSWRQAFPIPSSNTLITLEEFISTGKNEFAYQTLLMAWKDRAEDYYEVPSYLLAEADLEVKNNEMDISELKYFKSLPMDTWLVNLGGFDCHCKYVKSTANLEQLLCGDDSLDDAARTYFALGKKIVFPKGVHKTPLKIVYANRGEGVDGRIEVDEAIASLIRTKLNEIYLGRIPQSDTSNNSNPNS
jgi:hypothetical protein